MDIEKLQAEIECVVLENLHWQDMFRTGRNLYNEPFEFDDMKKIKDIGVLRYRNDALFNNRVQSLTAAVISEVQKALKEEESKRQQYGEYLTTVL